MYITLGKIFKLIKKKTLKVNPDKLPHILSFRQALKEKKNVACFVKKREEQTGCKVARGAH
jgi:hypothetical protein